MQIHKRIMGNILTKSIESEKLLSVCKTIIAHDPTQNYVLKGKAPKIGILPPHKTLFNEDKERGVPIGNLTSQFFANVYLNELDQFAKRNLGIKKYIRYVDDFILLSDSKEELITWKIKIIKYLEEHLLLELKDESVLPESVYDGIDFLGYIIKPNYTLIRRRVITNYKKALWQALPDKPFSKKGITHIQYYTKWENWKQLQARINSSLGHFAKANSFRIKKELTKTISHLYPFIQMCSGYLRLYPRYPNRFDSFHSQIQYYRISFPNRILLIQVGRFYEMIGIKKLSNTNSEKPNKESLLSKIRMFQRKNILTYGFHQKYLYSIIQRLQSKNIGGLLVRQDKMISENIKSRIPTYTWYCNEH